MPRLPSVRPAGRPRSALAPAARRAAQLLHSNLAGTAGGGWLSGRAWWLRAAAAGALLALLPGAARAWPHAPPAADRCAAARGALPADAELEAQGAVIGAIRLRPIDIFDTSIPAEDTRIFRLANRLHRTTRPAVIQSQLLIKPDDPYSRRRLDESERILRANHYLFEATICPVGYDGRHVDLEVTTQDVWTLKLGISLGRGGGVNTFKFLVADDNLLGTGKSLTAERLADVDRTAALLRYLDPAVFGSHWQAGASYSHNSDGDRAWLFAELPFFALDSRTAGGFEASDTDRIDSLYDRGEVRRRFREKIRFASANYGWSAGLVDDAVTRWSAGWTYDDHDFMPVRPGGRPPPGLRRTLSYPWIGLEWVQDAFATGSNLDQIYRVEDLFLGWRLHGQLGYSAAAFGGNLPSLVYSGQLDGGRQWGAKRTLLWNGSFEGRYRGGRTEGFLAQGKLRFYQRDFGDQLLFLSLDLAAANRLDPDRQLLLGGDSGLRGYPLRYQNGERRVLATIEQRVFSDWYPFRLVRVGAAAFFDIGRAWFPDAPLRLPELGWLKDVGCGLRLASSRSGFGNVVHVDVAFPFGDIGAVKKAQFVITTQASF